MRILLAFLVIIAASISRTTHADPKNADAAWPRLAGRLRGVEETYRKWGITFQVEKDASFARKAGPMMSTLKVTSGLESSDTFKLDVEAGLGLRNALGIVVSGTFKQGADPKDISGTGSMYIKASGIGGEFKYTREEGLVLEGGLEETFYSLGVTIGGDGKSPISIGLKGGPMTIRIDPVKWVSRCRESLSKAVRDPKVGGVMIRTDLGFLGSAIANARTPEIDKLRDVTVVSLKRILPAIKKGVAKDLAPLTTVIGLAHDAESSDVLLIGRAEPRMPTVQASHLIAILRSIWRDGLTPFVSLDPGPESEIVRLIPRVGGVSEGLEESPLLAAMLHADHRIKAVMFGPPRGSESAQLCPPIRRRMYWDRRSIP